MKEIFLQQQNFQKLLDVDINSQEFKNQMFLGLFGEVGEIMRETPFKKHRTGQVFNKSKYLSELADAQLYLFNLVLSECSYEEFLRIIKNKQEINLLRRKNGS